MTAKTLQYPATAGPIRATACGILVPLVLAMAACEAPPPTRPAPPQPIIGLDFEKESQASPNDSAAEDDAWLALEHMLDHGTGSPPANNARQAASLPPEDAQPWHALVLHTFQGDRQGQTAGVWAEQLGILIPPLKPDLGVHTGSKGSMVLYGHYDGWDDPKVADDMTALKNLRVNGKRIFGPIIRTTVRPQRRSDQIHPHELLSLRMRYPKVRTIYTLEIEIWGDFDSGTLSDEARRANAESRVAQLRADGTPAFFHHDPISRLSTVTIGAFDEQALDVASGLKSIEVEQWQRKFPNRLTNGEQLNLPVQGRPDLGAIPQRSRLVLVPEL